MSAPLAHLYALALRTLDAHERRLQALRARLAPVLAAGAAGLALLAGPAVSAVARGGPACGVALIVTICGAVVTVASVGRLLAGDARVLMLLTEMSCGILFVLCGLALTALVG
ncbi:MAG TPA: hypothetical protein VLK58_07670 [Conexibacter sp.]|nr:hypothetical protein [Conexibacter sp.]